MAAVAWEGLWFITDYWQGNGTGCEDATGVLSRHGEDTVRAVRTTSSPDYIPRAREYMQSMLYVYRFLRSRHCRALVVEICWLAHRR